MVQASASVNVAKKRSRLRIIIQRDTTNVTGGTVPPNTIVTAYGHLEDTETGEKLSGRTVKIELFRDGSLITTQPYAGEAAGGIYALKVLLDTPGTWTFKFSWTGDEVYEGCAEAKGTSAGEQPPPAPKIPWGLVLLVGLFILGTAEEKG